MNLFLCIFSLKFPLKLSGALVTVCAPEGRGGGIAKKANAVRRHKGELTGCTGTSSWKDFRICLLNAARKAGWGKVGGVLPVSKACRLGQEQQAEGAGVNK